MSYLDHDGLAYFKSKLDRTFIADIVFDDGDILLYGGDGTLLKTVVQEGTVTQKKSTTNKEYPILLCWDADAEEDQTMKTVWYGLDARINPKFGYLYARRYYTEHPSYERTSVPSARAEWHHIFTDAVSAPMGEVYEYLDRNSDGGEHRMELRLYGNPLSQYVDTPNHNEATDAVSIGVGATRGDKLTFFGYCPSTPIYLENGSTMRKSTVRGDQYGKDIITRDWLNLNGSITGLVHTYMDETIDGYKTFLKTVTIDSGNDNAKAGLNVQGDVNIDSGDNTKPSNFYVQGNSHIHGNEDIDGNLNVDGTSTLDGNVHMKHNLDVDGNLNVDGTSDQHGNVHMYNNLDVDGNANTDGNQTVGGTLTVTGKITGNGGAEISGGSGLKVNGNETVTGNLGVGGTINKVSGNTTQEYVTYVTNQADTRKNIAQNLVDTSRGVGYDASTGKIYVKASVDDGLKFNNDGTLAVDFSQMPTDKFEALLKGLKMLVPLEGNKAIYVDKLHANASDTLDDGRGTSNKPFKSINAAVTYVANTYSVGNYHINIYVGAASGSNAYVENVILPGFSRGTGYIEILPASGNRDVEVKAAVNSNGAASWCFSARGGEWHLRKLIISRVEHATSEKGQAFGCCVASESSRLFLYGCAINQSFPDSNALGGQDYEIRLLCADSTSELRLQHDTLTSTISAQTISDSGHDVHVFSILRGASLWLIGSYDTDANPNTTGVINCTGSCDCFLTMRQGGSVVTYGGGTLTSFTGSITGKRYALYGGSYVSGLGRLTATYFPGDSDGTVDANTYCWYQN